MWCEKLKNLTNEYSYYYCRHFKIVLKCYISLLDLFNSRVPPCPWNFHSDSNASIWLRIADHLDNKTYNFLIRLPNKFFISSTSIYIDVYGSLNIKWQITCNASNINYSCMVRAEKLRLYIPEGTEVNEFLN